MYHLNYISLVGNDDMDVYAMVVVFLLGLHRWVGRGYGGKYRMNR
jgi:hypothetical protein